MLKMPTFEITDTPREIRDCEPARRQPMTYRYSAGEKPLPGYTIRRGLGSGGFGDVYLAVSEAGKEVALKQIYRNLDIELRGTAQCLNLRHPNLVGLLDIQQPQEGTGWIVMDYVAGENLRNRLDRAPQGLDVREARKIFGQLGAGVHYLHDQGLVHRDLKPANIFIENGLVKIGDYGLSKFISASRRVGHTESVGTFHYMAPEISRGEYGKEIDLYSLGILLYEMLTGEVPFDGESSQEIILKHLTADPDLSKLPSPYRETVERALLKDPAARFHSVSDMLQAIGITIDSSGLAIDHGSPENMPESELPIAEEAVVQTTGAKKGYKSSFKRCFGKKKAAGENVKANQGMPGQQFKRTAFEQGRYAGRDGMGGIPQYSNKQRYAREPIANAFLGMLAEIKGWFGQIPHNSPWYGTVLAVVILVIIFQGRSLIPLLMSLMISYIPYYVVWSVFNGQQSAEENGTHGPFTDSPFGVKPQARPFETANKNNPAFRNASHAYTSVDLQGRTSPQNAETLSPIADAVHEPAFRQPTRPVPPSPAFRNFNQWQNATRDGLRNRNWLESTRELSWSFVSATTIVAILCVVGFLVSLAVSPTSVETSHFVSAGTWSAAMVLIVSWTVMFIGKRWERRKEDSLMFRFTLLTIGLGVGAAAFGLSEFLDVPWSAVAADDLPPTPRLWPRFHNGVSPLLPAFMAYFAMLMGMVRWWRQADIVRKHRFSIFSVLWSMLAATIATNIVFFPMPWCLVIAGCTSVVLQMSTPWISSKAEQAS